MKSLHDNVSCSVDVSQSLSEWFHVDSRVMQGCILSIPYSFFNDLMEEIKEAKAGVKCGGDVMVSGLLYADDVVTAPDEGSLQSLIDVIDAWCKKWGMNKVVHFRRKARSRARSPTKFTLRKRKYPIRSNTRAHSDGTPGMGRSLPRDSEQSK